MYQSMWDGHFVKNSNAKHRINHNLSDAAPINADLHRAGPRSWNLETKGADQIIKAGDAKQVTTEWGSPIVSVSEKDGRIRFCANYRRLNAVTNRDTNLNERMGECIDSTAEVQDIFNIES